MRFFLVLASLAIALSAHAQVAHARTVGTPLLPWTPQSWQMEGIGSSPMAGAYEKCGDYLFKFTPSREYAHKSMIGYRYNSPSGPVVLIRRGADITIREGGAGHSTNVSIPTGSGYIIVLTSAEFNKVYSCIGLKETSVQPTT